MLKELGMSSANGVNEAAWGVTMLWIALVIYIVNPLLNMDPLFGGVFIWSCCAIRSENKNAMLATNLDIIIGIMSAYVAIIAVVALYLKFKKSKIVDADDKGVRTSAAEVLYDNKQQEAADV